MQDVMKCEQMSQALGSEDHPLSEAMSEAEGKAAHLRELWEHLRKGHEWGEDGFCRVCGWDGNA